MVARDGYYTYYYRAAYYAYTAISYRYDRTYQTAAPVYNYIPAYYKYTPKSYGGYLYYTVYGYYTGITNRTISGKMKSYSETWYDGEWYQVSKVYHKYYYSSGSWWWHWYMRTMHYAERYVDGLYYSATGHNEWTLIQNGGNECVYAQNYLFYYEKTIKFEYYYAAAYYEYVAKKYYYKAPTYAYYRYEIPPYYAYTAPVYGYYRYDYLFSQYYEYIAPYYAYTAPIETNPSYYYYRFV